MSWNFRVMRHVEVYRSTGRVSEWLGIHEVHYKGLEVNDLTVSSDEVDYTVLPITITGESVEDLRFMLTGMLRAIKKPILEYKQTD